MLLAVILIVILILINPSPYCIFAWYRYGKSEYCRLTGNSYLYVLSDKGRYGEFLTYRKLAKIDGNKQFLFNIYIPKEDGTTTEIDALLIHETGLYVLESKNYSGWIFGTDTQKNWTQTLPQGKGRAPVKNKFFNPVMQNKGHTRALRTYLKDEQLPIRSVIVFSERCELKKVEITDSNCIVIKRDDLTWTMKALIKQAENILTAAGIDEIFQKLYPLTQMSDAQRQAHVDNINEKYKGGKKL